ncbi:MAG: glutamate-5-semialdehyde dehydrogenase [Oscillospiraceae bacterium]|nr:glutamate-5-semialdehyde dehydrogenase [Oscillospiraceae bacterium]
MTTLEILKYARSAVPYLAALGTEDKNRILMSMAAHLDASADYILRANAEDIESARASMGDVMLDRLTLTYDRISAMADGIRDVVALPDPVGAVLERIDRPNGLVIEKTRVPMGVVAIIYESRPNVTSDAAALALKSGNVCVLRGGKEAYRSSAAIIAALRRGLCAEGVPENLINMLEDTSRDGARELMTAVGYVDLLIPRGGAGLIRSCVENAKVPCIQTGTGICHIYVDGSANLEMALDIIENAKTSRPSVCNAAEVCLVNESVAPVFLPMLKKRLTGDRKAAGKTPVELRLSEKAAKYIDGKVAESDDFDTEFLDYILAVDTVPDVRAAVAHIAAHSTHHSDAIITESADSAAYFTAAVDSSAVYVNASTRFTDGGEFGLGCEIGISTQKLHARGPMGLNELTTYKYIIRGSGQIR